MNIKINDEEYVFRDWLWIENGSIIRQGFDKYNIVCHTIMISPFYDKFRINFYSSYELQLLFEKFYSENHKIVSSFMEGKKLVDEFLENFEKLKIFL